MVTRSNYWSMLPRTKQGLPWLQGGILREVHIERETKRGIVGNIYKGRVTRVLPGMQSAFVDIGLEKSGFFTRFRYRVAH